MAIDLSPFAGQPQPQLQQQPSMSPATRVNNGTVPGGITSIIKALQDGNDEYKKQLLAKTSQGQSGEPLTITHPMPQGMQGGAPLTPGIPAGMTTPMAPASAIPAGLQTPGVAPPINVDPVTQALFSPIPGG